MDPNPFTFNWGESEEEMCARALNGLHEQILMEGPI